MLVALKPFSSPELIEPGQAIIESHFLASSQIPGYGCNDHTWYLVDTEYAARDLFHDLAGGHWKIDQTNSDPNAIVLEYNGSQKKFIAFSKEEAVLLWI
jgi:hypothetical protein